MSRASMNARSPSSMVSWTRSSSIRSAMARVSNRSCSERLPSWNPSGMAPPLLGLTEPGVDQRYDGRALAAGRGDALHRAGPDVADGEHAGDGRRQALGRQAVGPLGLGHVAAGEHEAALVAGDGRREPVAA